MGPNLTKRECAFGGLFYGRKAITWNRKGGRLGNKKEGEKSITTDGQALSECKQKEETGEVTSQEGEWELPKAKFRVENRVHEDSEFLKISEKIALKRKFGGKGRGGLDQG